MSKKKNARQNESLLAYTFALLRTTDISSLVDWLAEGVDVNLCNRLGRAALHVAVSERRAEHIPVLLTETGVGYRLRG